MHSKIFDGSEEEYSQKSHHFFLQPKDYGKISLRQTRYLSHQKKAKQEINATIITIKQPTSHRVQRPWNINPMSILSRTPSIPYSTCSIIWRSTQNREILQSNFEQKVHVTFSSGSLSQIKYKTASKKLFIRESEKIFYKFIFQG